MACTISSVCPANAAPTSSRVENWNAAPVLPRHNNARSAVEVDNDGLIVDLRRARPALDIDGQGVVAGGRLV